MLSTPCSAHVLKIFYSLSHTRTHCFYLFSIHSSIRSFVHSFIQPSMHAFHSFTPSIAHLSFSDSSTYSIVHASFPFNMSFQRMTCVLNIDLQSTGLQTCWQAFTQQLFVCRHHVTLVACKCCVKSCAVPLLLRVLFIYLYTYCLPLFIYYTVCNIGISDCYCRCCYLTASML